MDASLTGKWTLPHEALSPAAGGQPQGRAARHAGGQGLRRLAEQCGADYQGGVLLYAGDNAFPLDGRRNLAMPLTRLWVM